jgi:diaminohydroxyphosphoribosylaminopyrimidine deaminase / 5-amino-6-(5-phosphoribosylamino)uracil reductase
VETNPIEQNAFDETMMRRALELARRGSGFVSPNPLVGAVIARLDRHVIGEGWHERFGGPHAEIKALESAQGRDLQGATMYVSLEPCNHHGKTPPCTEAIIASGIRRVIVAMRDPNPVVSGKGSKRLREAGIEVIEGVMEKEAQLLNEGYIHYITTGRPFTTVKMAQTLDGFIALPSGESQWITGELAREKVHQFRASSDAVMVGARTAEKDDPALTVRYGVQGRTPVRVVLDEHMSLRASLKLFTDEDRERTVLFTSIPHSDGERAADLRSAGVRVYGVGLSGGMLNLEEVLHILGELGVASLLVEGGATLVGSMIERNLAQKIVIFIAPKLFGHGVKGFTGPVVDQLEAAHRVDIYRAEMVGEDVMVTAYWHKA